MVVAFFQGSLIVPRAALAAPAETFGQHTCVREVAKCLKAVKGLFTKPVIGAKTLLLFQPP